MAEVSSQTLHIVARELASELNEARASLEAFGEQQDNLALLRKCNEHLHSVHGALRVAEVYGAALLAEEMGQVANYLIGNFNEKRHLAEGLDALMRAMVQLPTYLERVMSGGRDMALVLLPLLNDLRAVRGHALLSEGTLLLLNLSSDQQANPAGAAEGALTVAQWARKLRTRFQLGLLGWIKGERVDQNLEILSRTAEKLEHVATTQGVFQLWWVVGAVLESLREGGLESSASIKRLLGQADRDMKRLYELGESRYSDSPPLELLNNLLYYVARARTNGPRVAAVRASFRLSELLPVDEGVEQARESLSAPSVKLMKTVAAAIKEDLSRVKDALDIFVRQGGTQVDELAPQLELLKKIADTLGVLGLGELRDKVQSETADLQSIVAQKSAASEGTLLRMASTLIKVEDSLDEQLVGMIVPTQSEGGAPPKPAGPDDIEFRLVTEAVLRECIVNMARIKEAIAHSVEKPREAPAIDQIPQLMRGITAGLLMLGKTRVVEIMEGIDKALSQFVRSDGMTLPQEAVDRLADAIVAVEYYMETIQAGRTDPWYMLDNAETCLRFLADAKAIPRMDAYGVAATDHARTVVIEPTAQTIAATEHEPTAILDPVTNEIRRPNKPVAVPQPPAPAPMPPALTKPVDREVDPEFVELFIEEAKDEIAKLNQFFPLWDTNPQDAEALVNVRRSFHTLKGSGRMVGAQLIGDFAWSVENMLNRVINKTLDRTPDIMALMRSAVAAVPELVEQLETGRAPQADIAKVINTANTLAGVRPASASTMAATTPVVRRAPPPPVLKAPAMAPPTLSPQPEKKTAAEAITPSPVSSVPLVEPADPFLNEIYAKETAGHLAAIRKFIAACQLANAPYPVTEDLHRSCHTLSGTAKTAGARQGIKIAEPLNRYIRKLYDNSIGMPEAGLGALRDAVTAIQQVVDHINESTGFFVNHENVVKRLVELEHGLDSELSRLAEMLASTTANATAGDATGEYVAPSAVTSVNPRLRDAIREEPESEEISMSGDDVLDADDIEIPELTAIEPSPVSTGFTATHVAIHSDVLPLSGRIGVDEEPGTVELSPLDPSVLASGDIQRDPTVIEAASAPLESALESLAEGTPEEITLSSSAEPEEITLGSATDAADEFDFGAGTPEEITLDSTAGAVDELDLGAAAGTPEEVTLSSATDAVEEITLGSTIEPEEISLGSASDAAELNLGAGVGTPEEITLDSTAVALDELNLGAAAGTPEEVTLSSATDEAEEITLGSAAEPEEITLGSASDPVDEFDLGAGTPEEITLDSVTDAADQLSLSDAASALEAINLGGEPEAITLDSSLAEAEVVTMSAPADSDASADAVGAVVELEATDASTLDTLAWSYENFPADRAAAANSDLTSDVAANAGSIEEVDLTDGAELTQEAIVLESVDELLDAGIDVGEVSELDSTGIEGTGRALLQMNEPLPDDASDIIIETSAWAAEFEPQVLPMDVAPATNRDDAETIRTPSLADAAHANGGDFVPLDATRAVEVSPTLLPLEAAALVVELSDLVPAEASLEVTELPSELPPVEVSMQVSEPTPEPAPAEVSSWAASIEVEPFPAISATATVAALPTETAPAAPIQAPVAAQASVVASAAPVEEEEYDDSDFDPEVAAIFTEEATELLEAADQALSSWRQDRANSALVFELKRVVHTLKGGARMAGIRAMGDLSHELETLMGLVEVGQVKGEERVFDALQASLDELHRMRDIVANGDRCKTARNLMNRIRALCNGEPEPVAAAAPVAIAPVVSAPVAPIAPEVVPPVITPEPVFDAPPEEVVEIVDYSPDDKDIGSQTDIIPTLTEIEALTDQAIAEMEASETAPEVDPISDVEAEFGADELGAVAPREAVRIEETPVSVTNVAMAATGVHAALDVATVAPELPPDNEQQPQEEAVVAEPQAPALPGRERQVQQERQEFARVDADLLDNLLNNAGEVSIFRSRMEQQVGSIEFNLAELGRTVTRLKEQLRKLELETEAQILHRHQEEHPDRQDFDPLELDRYSTIQQLTRAFAESVSDVSSIEGLLENLTREAQNLLIQQSRVVTEMQNGLMRTRMVPFQRHVQRLSRLVRQVATDTNKRADLVVVGASGELDRQVLERMLPPFEHMLRNSVVHGIETPEERVQRGKSPQGTIKVGLHREGSEMVIVLEDDGRGIDVNAVRERAKQRGLLQAGRVLSDEEAMQLILEPGFSTASNITQHAGRGVGMDVVVNEIKKLGGALFTASEPGKGVKFTIRLPFTLAITQALIVRTGDELYALPLPSVEGVARITKSEVQKHLAEEVPTFNYGGQIYRLQHLGAFVGGGPSALPELDVSVPLILIRAGEHSTAIVTDELVGSREMVVKSVGPQIATIRGIAGATILGDGRIVIILDMGALVRSEWRGGKAPLETQGPREDKRTFVLVVDDSITVRRVTQRLLERNGMRVMTAKDGIDALSILQENIPDVILLDIEMPRMDGYELATQVRADARLTDIPIVMITSRVGEKHRARAIEIGVNDYLGKPYQENQLLDAIQPLVQARRRKVS